MSKENKKDELVEEHIKTDTSIQLTDNELKQVVGGDIESKPNVIIDNGSGFLKQEYIETKISENVFLSFLLEQKKSQVLNFD